MPVTLVPCGYKSALAFVLLTPLDQAGLAASDPAWRRAERRSGAGASHFTAATAELPGGLIGARVTRLPRAIGQQRQGTVTETQCTDMEVRPIA
jgi:hypothetical protein